MRAARLPLPCSGRRATNRVVTGRPSARPSRFADAGLSILRTEPADSPEIWVRCDGGPHGFLSIAAHAHADALSVEVRHGGIDILADPGTYCYHGEPAWRSYFKSTIAHNTVEIGGQSQSAEGGAFMWSRQARARELDVPDPAVNWTAEHDGYQALSPPAGHRRSVRLDPGARAVDIIDVIDGGRSRGQDGLSLRPARAGVARRCQGGAVLAGRGDTRGSTIALPAGLEWRAYRGSADPVLGWYSEGLGRRTPAVTLVGTGRCQRDAPLITRIEFDDLKLSNAAERVAVPSEAFDQPVRVSLGSSAGNPGDKSEITAEDCNESTAYEFAPCL